MPDGATYTDDTGTVLVDYEKCIGCRYCITACPYEVRQFNWSKPDGVEGIDGEYRWGYPEDYRQDGHLVYTPVRPEGVVEKCTFCVQYTNQGGTPACCTGCPANARIFGDIEDADSEISQYMSGREWLVLGESHGTKPKVYYLPSKRGEGE